MTFTQVPNEAIDRMTELSAGALRLYLFLLHCRNQKTGKCCPSVGVTAEAIDVHRKNVFKLRNELAAAGWAKFDGDTVTGLLGLESSKNTTADVEGIELAPESRKNTTIRVISSKNATNGSKNATFESQKHYPVVAKTLLNGSKNATAYKEEQDEGTRRIEQDEISRANALADGLDQRQCYALFVELRTSVGKYEVPYQNGAKDFVQLARLLKTCQRTHWTLTADRFSQAVRHYFATPQSSHTLADLATRFSEFFKHPLDRFGKPVRTADDPLTQLTPNAQQTVIALESFVARNMAKENV